MLGSINLDITIRVDDLPRPGQTVLGRDATRGLGGKGANQAVAAAQLLGRSRMIGAVGTDPEGGWLLDRLAAFGVDVSTVQRDEHHPTGLALIGVDERGENSIIVSPGANAHLTAPASAAVDAAALMIQFEIPLDTATRAVEEFHGFVAVNPSPTQSIPAALLHRADLFVVNAEEYRQLPELEQATLVVVTLGSQGAEARAHGRRTHAVPAHPVMQAANTVGAGDAFVASLVSALIVDTPLPEALRVAAMVASAVVEDLGSQTRLDPLGSYIARVASDSRSR
ncbi:ribokinase [Phycicoccus ginsengisoli]